MPVTHIQDQQEDDPFEDDEIGVGELVGLYLSISPEPDDDELMVLSDLLSTDVDTLAKYIQEYTDGQGQEEDGQDDPEQFLDDEDDTDDDEDINLFISAYLIFNPDTDADDLEELATLLGLNQSQLQERIETLLQPEDTNGE